MLSSLLLSVKFCDLAHRCSVSCLNLEQHPAEQPTSTDPPPLPAEPPPCILPATITLHRSLGSSCTYLAVGGAPRAASNVDPRSSWECDCVQRPEKLRDVEIHRGPSRALPLHSPAARSWRAHLPRSLCSHLRCTHLQDSPEREAQAPHPPGCRCAPPVQVRPVQVRPMQVHPVQVRPVQPLPPQGLGCSFHVRKRLKRHRDP